MLHTISEKQSNDTFVRAREMLLEDVKVELSGPEKDPGILFFENPVTRYSVGLLFPSGYEKKGSDKEAETPVDGAEPAEGETDVDSPADDLTAALSNKFFPSAMGLSFYCKGEDPKLKVEVECATYNKADLTEAYVRIEGLPEEITTLPEFVENFIYENGFVRLRKKIEEIRELRAVLKDKLSEESHYSALDKLITSQIEGGTWLRIPHSVTLDIDASSRRLHVMEGLDLVVVRKYVPSINLTLFTIALENHNEHSGGLGEEGVFFQVSIKVKSNEGKDIFSEYVSTQLADDDEEANLQMLYRNKKTYAVGHGCAASWTIVGGKVQTLLTDTIPTYEVPKASFEVEELEGSNILDMRRLCGLDGKIEDIIPSLEKFSSAYINWIKLLKEKKRSIDQKYEHQANKNIQLCEEAHSRMVKGIQILKGNENAFTAFLLANRAMLMQSIYSELQKTRRNPGEGEIPWPSLDNEATTKGKKWRPFQLAFILLSIDGIVTPASDDRKLVDLIWFSTGGGKTEAYLGLSAFTIFYKRLATDKHVFGTVVMMRYTLRLLTAQQFQRASTLICAMELIRRMDSDRLGEEEISIGLWVGAASTPNTIEEAKRKFEEFKSNSYTPCPSPVLSCPWCGTRMLLKNPSGSREYAMRDKTRPKRIEIFCKEPTCAFYGGTSRLPIKFVDDDIYSAPPTLLFGTVDKFAQMPMKKGISKIFGLDTGSSPELIIQDELHLISGALGTIVALYETAIDFFCSKSGRLPKVIASTATVRRAEEQCKSLFGRSARQFPPPGLEIEDSFFSREDSIGPGRLYVGVMPSGKTQTTTSIRLTAKLLQGVYELPQDDRVKDKYSTLICYFNSIRELGGFISLIHDDIELYANNLRLRYGGKHMRRIYRYDELTSRKSAEDIPQILEQLLVEYTNESTETKKWKNSPTDILVATNMISVGVDIDRFGIMLVRGQPKLTSEYIQVSSRIGRKYPGMVVTLYNPARTRDRSHYERFRTYHESFYRSVEPSSITPFSLPARIRALNAVLVAMVRHTLKIEGIQDEDGPVCFKSNLPGVQEIQDFVLNRVRLIDPAEASEVEKDIVRAWKEWESYSSAFSNPEEKPVYSNFRQNPRTLLGSTTRSNRPIGWIAPTSMRNVDAESNINTRDE